jgi:flagellar capping protein FliD
MGITITGGSMSISDSAKLTSYLTDYGDDVKGFLDAKMEKLSDLLDTYVGSDNSYVDYTITSLKAQKTKVTNDITTETTRLSNRQAELIKYYENLDSTMNELLNEQTAFKSWLNGTSSSTST